MMETAVPPSAQQEKPFFSWDDTFALDVSSIDAQHQAIVAMVNDLHEALVKKLPPLVVESIVHKLSAYAVSHFEYEEQCMELCSFAHLHSHQCEHRSMMKTVKEFEKAIVAGDTSVYLSLLDFLLDWLHRHIKVTDRQYVPDFQHFHIP